MRVMVLVKANEDSEAGIAPSTELLNEMGKYNEELVKAGIMLDGEGLHPSSEGARIQFSGSDRRVVDGPFAETKELVAGYWLIQVSSLEEAIEWVRRVPNPDLEEAERRWKDALEHAERAGDERVIAGILRSLAIAAGSRGDQLAAVQLLDSPDDRARLSGAASSLYLERFHVERALTTLLGESGE